VELFIILNHEVIILNRDLLHHHREKGGNGMGKMQRTKGINAERELVHLLEDLGVQAHRVPLSGAMANYKDDIILADESSIEVKRRKKMPAILNEMLISADYGAIREDRGEWLVVMRVKEFAHLFNRYLEREHELNNKKSE
jgi:Holliday junction resolvase